MSQDELYAQAVADFGPALERLARSYEADPDKRRDLLQEIHLAIWRSFGQFQHQCSLRTWVYRVAHNAGATHVIRDRRSKSASFVSLDEVASTPAPRESSAAADRRNTLERIYALIQRLKPLDRGSHQDHSIRDCVIHRHHARGDPAQHEGGEEVPAPDRRSRSPEDAAMKRRRPFAHY